MFGLIQQTRKVWPLRTAMASKIRSLLTSQASTPRAASTDADSKSGEPDSPFSRAFSSSGTGMSMSPSFSDFSMGLSPAEAEREFGVRACTSVPVSPMAFDSRPLAPAPRLSLDSLRARGIWGTLAGAASQCTSQRTLIQMRLRS